MHKLLLNSPGEKVLLLGNEAIARGAIEAGLAFATCYPGTPSSEIPDQFFHIAKETDLYFEYSTNEKVALEVASGAAIPGLRTMVTMKHVGLNVAADPLMTLAYTGVKGGMVIVNADDPYMFSSQNEQDNRIYSRISSLPMLEPTNTQEMKDWTATAFEISEELELPVILRTTTRLSHNRGPVILGEMRPIKSKTTFNKDPFHYVCLPAVSKKLHKELIEKYNRALSMSDNSPYNEITGEGKFGIIANGVSFNYVKDAIADLGIEHKTSIFKLGFSYPMPRGLCIRFMRNCKKILVVEELEPVIENDLRAIAISSPPATMRVHPDDVKKFIDTAFRIWVTEVRPSLLEAGRNCENGPPLEECVLLAQLEFQFEEIDSLLRVSSEVDINQDKRPYLLQSHLLQESLCSMYRSLTFLGIRSNIEKRISLSPLSSRRVSGTAHFMTMQGIPVIRYRQGGDAAFTLPVPDDMDFTEPVQARLIYTFSATENVNITWRILNRFYALDETLPAGISDYAEILLPETIPLEQSNSLLATDYFTLPDSVHSDDISGTLRVQLDASPSTTFNVYVLEVQVTYTANMMGRQSS